MPGLFGILRPAPPDPGGISAMAEAMADRLKHHRWYTVDRYVDPAEGLALGRVTLGFVNTVEQPAWNEDRTLLAVMDGEVYDYAARRRELESAGHQFRGGSQAELLLHGLEHRGREFFRDLDGTFA